MSAPEPAVRVVARVNVALTPDTAEALRALVERTGLKQVDVVNRGVQLYELVDAEQRKGAALYVRGADGVLERLRVL
jgi:hypothetical protein